MGNHTIQTIFLTAVCLLLAALPSQGQEEEESRLELGVQLLGHGEVRNGGFNESMAEEEADDNSHAGFMMSRTRVTADFLQKGLSARVTAQHAGVWGQKGQGSLNLNEAWARLSLKNGLFGQLGRQALSYDDERIIGPNDWAMAYMTHDVLKLGYEGNGHRLHAILAYNQNAENTYGGTYYSCLIAHNTLSGTGNSGGAACWEGRYYNCTITGNTVAKGPGGFGSCAAVVNTISWGNNSANSANDFATATTNTCVARYTAAAADSGVIKTDPLFRATAGQKAYRLKSGSPCKGTGLLEPWMAPARDARAYDLVGKPLAPGGAAPDMGCYAYEPLALFLKVR